MHGCTVERLHWKRCIASEAAVVVHWGLMVGVESGALVPARGLIVKVVVVVVVVLLHLQLAHGDGVAERKERSRAWIPSRCECEYKC